MVNCWFVFQITLMLGVYGMSSHSSVKSAPFGMCGDIVSSKFKAMPIRDVKGFHAQIPLVGSKTGDGVGCVHVPDMVFWPAIASVE